MIDDCSKHTREVMEVYDMQYLAELISKLHYETLSSLLLKLSKCIEVQSVKDLEDGKENLSKALQRMSYDLKLAYNSAATVWQICKPFMKNE